MSGHFGRLEALEAAAGVRYLVERKLANPDAVGILGAYPARACVMRAF
jgi:hypothetical protein